MDRLEYLESVDIKISKNEFLIDVGCGCGDFVSHLVQKEKIKQSYGIDLLEQISRAKKENEEIAHHFFEACGEKLPFDDDSANFIVFDKSFHHMEDQVKVISEIERVLKNNGSAVFIEPVFSPEKEDDVGKLIFGLGIRNCKHDHGHHHKKVSPKHDHHKKVDSKDYDVIGKESIFKEFQELSQQFCSGFCDNCPIKFYCPFYWEIMCFWYFNQPCLCVCKNQVPKTRLERIDNNEKIAHSNFHHHHHEHSKSAKIVREGTKVLIPTKEKIFVKKVSVKEFLKDSERVSGILKKEYEKAVIKYNDELKQKRNGKDILYSFVLRINVLTKK